MDSSIPLRRARPVHVARCLTAAAIGFLGACRPPTRVDDHGVCRQTYEFSNTGCFEVEGAVVGTAGQPLTGIAVGPRYLHDDALFNTQYVTTDDAGQFRFRASRMLGSPPSEPRPDTVSVYVIAADPRSAGLNVTATVRDSVLVVVTVAPVGTVPTPAVVRITLPVP
jgi:hypothetical protein